MIRALIKPTHKPIREYDKGLETYPHDDARSGIRSDPNRPDDPESIVRFVGQLVRVSLETVRVGGGLPEQYAG